MINLKCVWGSQAQVFTWEISRVSPELRGEARLRDVVWKLTAVTVAVEAVAAGVQSKAEKDEPANGVRNHVEQH